jgi:hypothetical protein
MWNEVWPAFYSKPSLVSDLHGSMLIAFSLHLVVVVENEVGHYTLAFADRNHISNELGSYFFSTQPAPNGDSNIDIGNSIESIHNLVVVLTRGVKSLVEILPVDIFSVSLCKLVLRVDFMNVGRLLGGGSRPFWRIP